MDFAVIRVETFGIFGHLIENDELGHWYLLSTLDLFYFCKSATSTAKVPIGQFVDDKTSRVGDLISLGTNKSLPPLPRFFPNAPRTLFTPVSIPREAPLCWHDSRYAGSELLVRTSAAPAVDGVTARA
jgi:hypothetical protein